MERVPACLRHDERGTTAIEYGLIAALVVLGLLVGLSNYGAVVEALYAVVETINAVM